MQNIQYTVIGNAILYLGSCHDVIPTITQQIDALISDPPYGIAYSPGGGGGGIRDKNGKRIKKRFSGDNLVIGDEAPFNPTHLLNISPITVLWGGNHFADKLPASSCWLIWDKRCGTTTNDFADCEMAWTNMKKPARLINHLWNGMLKDSERGEPRVHPTQKPITVMEWCINHASMPGDTIFDPYMGSGTTGVAAIKSGRRFIGVEIDPNHYQTAIKRIAEAVAQPDLLTPFQTWVQEPLL